MQQGLRGLRVAVLAADGAEGRELTEVRRALEDAGATVESVTPDSDPAAYDAVVLAGGAPAAQRGGDAVVSFVRRFAELDRPIAAIGEGSRVLIDAGIVRGRTLTGAPDLRADVEGAGGTWADKQV